MKEYAFLPLASMFLSAALLSPARAVTVPFTEDFTGGDAEWSDTLSSPPPVLDHFSTGGIDDGPYVSDTIAFGGSSFGTTVFRANGVTYDASGDAFVGDWITAGVTQFSAWVRHNAPVPVEYGVRFATPGNFPAVATNIPDLVPPNEWTEIVVAIDPANTMLVAEAGNYFSNFSGIGRLQISVGRPESLAGDMTAYTFDLDRVQLVPEPSSMGLAVAALLGLAGCSRPRRHPRGRKRREP
jgi:hypothetical protein